MLDRKEGLPKQVDNRVRCNSNNLRNKHHKINIQADLGPSIALGFLDSLYSSFRRTLLPCTRSMAMFTATSKYALHTTAVRPDGNATRQLTLA